MYRAEKDPRNIFLYRLYTFRREHHGVMPEIVVISKTTEELLIKVFPRPDLAFNEFGMSIKQIMGMDVYINNWLGDFEFTFGKRK